jgi:DNA end-binding protein Ku
MAPRANWKGYLKLSLVSCAVALYPATSTSQRIRFNIVNRETGNRIRYKQVDSETEKEVPEEDRVKGYKTSDGSYVLVEDDELDEVALESTHTIEIESFVPRDEVDEIYLDESFYLAPDDKVGVEAFAVIREAMEEKSLVGLARVVLYRRERLLMLQPRDKGIMATALRYRDEVRDADAYFDDIPNVRLSSDTRKLAEHILETKRAKFDPDKFEDRYEDALKALIKAKQAGKEPPKAPTAKPSNVINLMDALRRSVKEERGSAPRHGGRRRASGHRRKAAHPARKAKRLKRAS